MRNNVGNLIPLSSFSSLIVEARKEKGKEEGYTPGSISGSSVPLRSLTDSKEGDFLRVLTILYSLVSSRGFPRRECIDYPDVH